VQLRSLAYNVIAEIHIPKGSEVRVYGAEKEFLRVFPKEYDYIFMAIEVQPTVKSG